MPTTIYELKIYNPYDSYLSFIGRDKTKYDRISEKVKKLPENFQDFIFNNLLADFIKDHISVPLGLNQNQSKELAIIVMELILTDIYLGSVVEEIKTRLGIDDMKAKTIAGLVVTELFAPILEDLKKMHVEKFAKNMPKSNQQTDDRVVDLKNNL